MEERKIFYNELIEAETRFYELDPVSRLRDRLEFEAKFKAFASQNPGEPLEDATTYDLFSIYDAVTRRG